MPSQESYRDALRRVIEDVIIPGAAEVDAAGGFPREQVSALAEAGLLVLHDLIGGARCDLPLPGSVA